MSRGLGSAQRLILDELHSLPEGYGVELGTSGLRRAAHGLENAGLVTLESRLIRGRLRLVAFLADSSTAEPHTLSRARATPPPLPGGNSRTPRGWSLGSLTENAAVISHD